MNRLLQSGNKQAKKYRDKQEKYVFEAENKLIEQKVSLIFHIANFMDLYMDFHSVFYYVPLTYFGLPLFFT